MPLDMSGSRIRQIAYVSMGGTTVVSKKTCGALYYFLTAFFKSTTILFDWHDRVSSCSSPSTKEPTSSPFQPQNNLPSSDSNHCRGYRSKHSQQSLQHTSTMMKQMRFSILAVLLLLGLFKNASAQSCINDIQRLVVLENDVPDFSVLRTYIVCPGSLLNIGKLDTNFNLVGSNQPAVPLRPNMHLKCGDNGKRENYCAFINGDVHLDATKVLGVVDNERVDNILIEGFVFINSHKYSLWATKPGSIIFRDCEWRVSERSVKKLAVEILCLFQSHIAIPLVVFQEHTASLVPILLDFFDGTNAQLSVTFENCLFKVSDELQGIFRSLSLSSRQRNQAKLIFCFVRITVTLD